MEPKPTPHIPMVDADRPSKIDGEVSAFLNEYSEAVRSGDLETIMAFYEDDVVAFDMMPPLEIEGKDEYRQTWKECFTGVSKFPIEFEIKPLRVTTLQDTAIVYGFSHVVGEFKDTGEKVNNWLRITAVLKKHGDQWRFLHEHNSVPLGQDMKGLMDLNPADKSH